MTAPDYRQQPRAFLEHLYRAAVHRALPLHNTAAFLPPPPKGRTVVLGAGKAGGAMAQAVEALWPREAPLSGLVVTRYHHTPPRPSGLPERIEVVEAAHPVPDAAGLQAAERILSLAHGLTPDDLVLYEGQRLTSISREERSHFDFANILGAILEDFIAAGWWPSSVDNFAMKFVTK